VTETFPVFGCYDFAETFENFRDKLSPKFSVTMLKNKFNPQKKGVGLPSILAIRRPFECHPRDLDGIQSRAKGLNQQICIAERK